MTVDVIRITEERLAHWAIDCVRDHATPALLLAIGHDEQQGEIHIYVPDDPMFDRQTIRKLLTMARNNL
jgi:hypothetical protein